jgi:hypothetical protein
MAQFQVRYWFESNSREKTGEQVVENVEASSVQEVAQVVRERMSQATFLVSPSFGPAAAGMVVVNAAAVRYVEIVPNTTAGGVPIQ